MYIYIYVSKISYIYIGNTILNDLITGACFSEVYPLVLRFGDNFARTLITSSVIINAQRRGNIRVLITK